MTKSDKKYVLMCNQSEELGKIHYCLVPFPIPFPCVTTVEDLLRMLGLEDPWTLVLELYVEMSSGNKLLGSINKYYKQFDSLPQVLLAYWMSDRHGRIWKNEQWVEEKEKEHGV